MDFIILKVNSQDVTGLNHREAVQVFQDAEEPITVQVLRRPQNNNATPTPSDTHLPAKSSVSSSQQENPGEQGDGKSEVDGQLRQETDCDRVHDGEDRFLITTGTQTELSSVRLGWDIILPDWVPGVGGGSESDSPDGDYVFPGDLPQSLSQYLDQEIDIEEIILERSFADEKLGITLYYSNAPAPPPPPSHVSTKEAEEDVKDDTKAVITEVLVSQIDPAGLAARDGRIRIGDQILQINGIELTSKEQTEELANDSGIRVTLLVSRTQYYDEDDLVEGDILEDVVEEDEEVEVLDANFEFNTSSYKGRSFQKSLGLNKTVPLIAEEDEDAEEGHTVGTTCSSSSSSSHSEQKGPVCSSASSTTSSRSSHAKGSFSTVEEEMANVSKLAETLTEDCQQLEAKNAAVLREQQESQTKIAQPVKTNTYQRMAERPPAKLPVSMGSESEHIYESIPEVTESDEPIYSIPYEPGNERKTKQKASTGSPKQIPQSQKVQLSNNSTGKIDPRGTRSSGTSSSSGGSTRKHCSSRNEQRKVAVLKKNDRSPRGGSNPNDCRLHTSSTSSATKRVTDSSTKQNEVPVEDRDSSSAYNTGDSTGSTHKPAALELSLNSDPTLRQSTLTLCPPTHDQSLQVSLESEAYTAISCDSCRRCMQLPPLKSQIASRGQRHDQSNPGRTNSQSIPSPGSKPSEDGRNAYGQVPFLPAQTMYTNPANLQQTIWLQQQLFRQALGRGRSTKPTHQSSIYGNHHHTISSKGTSVQPLTPTGEPVEMEWKVKRRADGTRYITRRPVRSKILKERALKISEERAGFTTDDDAVSEMKLGRYWPKEERKRQLEKERERRRHLDILRRQHRQPTQQQQFIPQLQQSCAFKQNPHQHKDETVNPLRTLTLENGVHQALWRDQSSRRKAADNISAQQRKSFSASLKKHQKDPEEASSKRGDLPAPPQLPPPPPPLQISKGMLSVTTV